MHNELIEIEAEGAIVSLTLNRPAARNALSVALCTEMIRALEDIRRLYKEKRARVVVLKGRGSAFCAGADLKERAGMSPGASSSHSALIARCGDELAALPCPVIASIHGPALGGGLELALACDIRVVARDAILGFPEVTYGFFPGAGGPVRLARLVGISTATYLLMTARRITGEEAARLTIAQVCCEAEELDATTAKLAAELASYPPEGVRALRELLASLDEKRTRGGMRRARALRDALNGNPAVEESLRKFRSEQRARSV